MMLDIVRSILRCGKVDPADIAREFVADHESQGIRFSGFAVTYALKRLRKGIPWDRSGLDDEQSAGNGSAMRVAPVGLLHSQNPGAADLVHRDAELSSVMTHRHPEAIAGARAVAYVVWRAASGSLDTSTLIAETREFVGPSRLADNLGRAGDLLAKGTPTQEALRMLGTTGFVVHTVASALFCFLKTPSDFERSVIEAVMGGDDADTTAAITGAISGAYNGIEAIPARWRDNVEETRAIHALATDLWNLACADAAAYS